MQDKSGDFARVHIAPGDVFEINNAIMHMVRGMRRHPGCLGVRFNRENVYDYPRFAARQVMNSKTEERVHLLLDVSEEPVTCKRLKAGQQCEYHNAQGVIC